MTEDAVPDKASLTKRERHISKAKQILRPPTKGCSDEYKAISCEWAMELWYTEILDGNTSTGFRISASFVLQQRCRRITRHVQHENERAVLTCVAFARVGRRYGRIKCLRTLDLLCSAHAQCSYPGSCPNPWNRSFWLLFTTATSAVGAVNTIATACHHRCH